MLCYCEKCGRIILFIINENELECDCCENKVIPVPKHFLKSEFSIKDELKQQFIDEYIKTSPKFDQYLFDHRDEILAKKSAQFDAAMAHGRTIAEEKSRKACCSYCGSSNTKKITMTTKAVHTALFGKLALGKVIKQWHCNNCGSDF